MLKAGLEHIGGQAKVDEIANELYKRIESDDVLRRHFKGGSLQRVANSQSKMIASILGGPSHLSIEQLRQTHSHLVLTDEDWSRLAAHFKQTLEDGDVPERERNFLIKTILDLRAQIEPLD